MQSTGTGTGTQIRHRLLPLALQADRIGLVRSQFSGVIPGLADHRGTSSLATGISTWAQPRDARPSRVPRLGIEPIETRRHGVASRARSKADCRHDRVVGRRHPWWAGSWSQDHTLPAPIGDTRRAAELGTLPAYLRHLRERPQRRCLGDEAVGGRLPIRRDPIYCERFAFRSPGVVVSQTASYLHDPHSTPTQKPNGPVTVAGRRSKRPRKASASL